MSASYHFYVEVKVNGTWHCINPKYPHFKEDYENHKVFDEYEYRTEETYWNGSRSYFGASYDKFRELGNEIKYAELSDELQKLYKNSCDAEANDDMVWCRPVVVDYTYFINYVKDDEYDRHGLVHKDILFDYKNGDREELYALDHEEAKDLKTEEMKAYEYFEWDDWYEWNWGLKEVKKRAIANVRDFEDINYMLGDTEIRIVMIGG